MNRLFLFLTAAACVISSGCASIVSGTNQTISVETKMKGEAVAGANCKLENNKGVWFIATPGSVVVNRSYRDMSVRCEKDGIVPGVSTVKSSTKAMAFGNILFGGVIGASVDIATGSAYDYPSLFTIEMGSAGVIPAPATDAAPTSASNSPCAVKMEPGCTN